MNGIFKKASCLILAGMLTTACISCKKKPAATVTKPTPTVTPPNYTLDEYTFAYI